MIQNDGNNFLVYLRMPSPGKTENLHASTNSTANQHHSDNNVQLPFDSVNIFNANKHLLEKKGLYDNLLA